MSCTDLKRVIVKHNVIPLFSFPETGDDAGISYVLIVDDPVVGEAKPNIVVEEEVLVESKHDKNHSVYQIGDGNNILIEEEDEEEEEEELYPNARSKTTVRRPRQPKVVIADNAGEYNCNQCAYVTTKRHLLARHMKCHSDDRPHKCVVCERGFKTVASLNNHVNTHTGTKPHRCKHCDSTFTTSGELVRHVRYKHTLEKPHKCPDCDYASVELSKLRRHIRCHTGERPFQCPHCTYASPDTFKLKRHLRIHTGEKPYQCDICQAKFTQSNSLKAHKLIHNLGDKPVFQCEYCPTTCGRKTDLRIHIQKLHTTDTPFPCRKCHETFPDRYNFKLHMKTHEGERCFKCDYCEYKAMSARHLESHILTHTHEKPFQCPDCDQAFRQKQLLKRHVNLYHNPSYVPPKPKEKLHNCPTCDRGFRHKGNLIRHIATHDPKLEGSGEGGQLNIETIEEGADKYEEAFAFTEDEEDEEEDDEELDEDAVEYAEEEVEHVDEDGNRFVVLEVINNQDEIEMVG